jgi:hypothetical protein
MPEELNDNLEENLEETGEEENLDTEETTEEAPKESILDTIKNKIKSFTSKNEEQETAVVIPDDFTKAALIQGWSSEDVKGFAKDYTEAELKEMIPALLSEDSDESDETSDTLEEEETEEQKDEDSQEDEKTKKLLERIEALEKAQGKSHEEDQKQEFIGFIRTASQAFDEASKEFEVFGQTKDLPKFPDGRLIHTSPQMKARDEVFDLACQLQGTGMDFDNALSVSLNAFKGKNLTKDVKRNLIKDLKGKEKRLSGKRTSHESGTKEMTGPEVIRAILNKNNK